MVVPETWGHATVNLQKPASGFLADQRKEWERGVDVPTNIVEIALDQHTCLFHS